MSWENVEIVRRGFTAAIEEDWPTVLDALDPHVEIRDLDVPDAGTYQGHDGFYAWLENWSAGWEAWRVEDVEFRAAPEEQVIALFDMIATGGGSGVEVTRRDAIVYRLSDRRIVRMEYFNDQLRALEAVGLSE